MDDLQGISDEEVDMMDKSLDIPNAAARNIELFDMLRDMVFSVQHAGALGLALQPRFE